MRCEPSQQNILITKFVFRLNLQRFQAFINPWTEENFSIAQSRMDNPEKLAAYGTQDEEKQNKQAKKAKK
jgi:hypothetical protein